jgi:hypothetical protein
VTFNVVQFIDQIRFSENLMSAIETCAEGFRGHLISGAVEIEADQTKVCMPRGLIRDDPMPTPANQSYFPFVD